MGDATPEYSSSSYTDEGEITSLPTNPHDARVFELSKSIWGGSDHHQTPLKKMKMIKLEFEDDLRELRVKELLLYQQSLLLEHKKHNLNLQLLKSQLMNQIEEKNTSQGSTDDEEEKEEEEEEKREEVLQYTKTDLLARFSEDDKMKGGDQNHSSETEMNVHDDLPVYEKVVDDGKRSRKKKSKRKKRKAVKVKTTLPSGIIIEELAEGDANGKLAYRGMKVKVNFIAKIKDTEQIIDSSGTSPRIFWLGDDAMIDGLCIGVEGMRVGGKRRIIIPPSMGFGEAGFGDVVPPNSWLEYEVELLGVRRRSD